MLPLIFAIFSPISFCSYSFFSWCSFLLWLLLVFFFCPFQFHVAPLMAALEESIYLESDSICCFSYDNCDFYSLRMFHFSLFSIFLSSQFFPLLIFCPIRFHITQFIFDSVTTNERTFHTDFLPHAMK